GWAGGALWWRGGGLPKSRSSGWAGVSVTRLWGAKATCTSSTCQSGAVPGRKKERNSSVAHARLIASGSTRHCNGSCVFNRCLLRVAGNTCRQWCHRIGTTWSGASRRRVQSALHRPHFTIVVRHQQQVGAPAGEQTDSENARQGVDGVLQCNRIVDLQVVHIQNDVAIVRGEAVA